MRRKLLTSRLLAGKVSSGKDADTHHLVNDKTPDALELEDKKRRRRVSKNITHVELTDMLC